MKQYTTASEAIVDMNARGYSNDFQIFGNDLLWVQEKIFIKSGQFAIIEYHRFWHPSQKTSDLIIFGIIAVKYNIRGILTNNYTSLNTIVPPVLLGKLDELAQKVLYQTFL